MPPVPQYMGLQSVDVASGMCIVKAPGEPQRTWQAPTQDIARRLHAWLMRADNRPLQEVVPELTDTEREYMLTGYTDEQQAVVFAKPKE